MPNAVKMRPPKLAPAHFITDDQDHTQTHCNAHGCQLLYTYIYIFIYTYYVHCWYITIYICILHAWFITSEMQSDSLAPQWALSWQICSCHRNTKRRGYQQDVLTGQHMSMTGNCDAFSSSRQTWKMSATLDMPTCMVSQLHVRLHDPVRCTTLANWIKIEIWGGARTN